MKQFPVVLAIWCAGLLLALTGGSLTAADDAKDKDKKPAASFDDDSATLTETVDGKEKKTKIDLKYSLKVKGFFADDGFHMEEVAPGGPATMLSGGVGLEKGDIIVEVDGMKIKSAKDYAKAMNGVADATKIKLIIKDVNTGTDQELFAEAAKR